MQLQPFNLIGGFYSDVDKAWSVQDTVNYIPEISGDQGTRTSAKLRCAPGLKPIVNTGSRPIRVGGMHDVEGKLFVVSDKLYQITNSGVAIPQGVIPGVGPVWMEHNQRSGGNELLVTNGQSGYVYNTATTVFQKITDEGYPGANTIAYMDSYLLQSEPFGRFFFWSDLADALSYNTLDRAESEASPDLIVGLTTNQFEVIVFNQTTTEFFQNTGAARGTFQSKKVVITVGCAGRNTIVTKLDNSVFWLDHFGRIVRLDGYSAVPVSTTPVEQAISQYNWANAFAFKYESEGHQIYYITFPDGLTFGYDVVTRLWHRRQSFNLDRWRLNTLVRNNNRWIGGDFQNGLLYEVDWDYMLEADKTMVRERTSGVTSNNQNRLGVPYLELVFETGQPETIPVVAPPQPNPPTISGSAPDSARFLPYSYTYMIGGGTGTLVVSVHTGTLPPGLTLSALGVLEGTPTDVGTYVFTVRVTDENGLWNEVSESVQITNSVLALATRDYLFKGTPPIIVEDIPIDILAADRTLSVSANTRFVAAGNTNPPYYQIKQLRLDKTGYNDLPPIADAPDDRVLATQFSPKSDFLALSYKRAGSTDTYPNARLRIYRISGATFTKVAEVDGTGGEGVTWSPNGLRIAWSQGLDLTSHGIRIFDFDPATGTLGTPVYMTGNISPQGAYKFNWHPSGNFLAEEQNNRLVVWDARNNPITMVDDGLDTQPNSGRGALWSADGQYIYTFSGAAVGGHTAASWFFTGSSLAAPVFPAVQPPSNPQDASISSDGKTIAIGIGSNPGASVYIYTVNNSVMTPAATQPVTTASTTAALAWTTK